MVTYKLHTSKSFSNELTEIPFENLRENYIIKVR